MCNFFWRRPRWSYSRSYIKGINDFSQGDLIAQVTQIIGRNRGAHDCSAAQASRFTTSLTTVPLTTLVEAGYFLSPLAG